MARKPDTNWFETWFDTPLYEELYAHRDMAEARKLADLVHFHTPPGAFPRLLDVGCGRGRHSINLARLGYSVTGIDLSENAINKANGLKKALPFSERLHFRVHDMRNPINERFSLVVNLFTSFGYMKADAENRNVLAHMCKSVEPEGALIIDYLNAGFVKSGLVSTETQIIKGYSVEVSRRIEEDMVIKNMTFRHDDQPSRSFSEEVKLYDESWFKNELEKQGFTISATFGDYEGGAHHPEKSPRLILLARLM